MKISELPEDIDLGDSRTLHFFPWEGDAAVAFTMYHPSAKDTKSHKSGEQCSSGGYLAVAECPPMIPDSQRWTVESWFPLTLSPSILCLRCGDHGFIRDGKWVSA